MVDDAAVTWPHAERRDLRARAARNELSHLLGIEPGQLRWITAEVAEALIADITRGSQESEQAARMTAIRFLGKGFVR